jgi:hypothetical protein
VSGHHGRSSCDSWRETTWPVTTQRHSLGVSTPWLCYWFSRDCAFTVHLTVQLCICDLTQQGLCIDCAFDCATVHLWSDSAGTVHLTVHAHGLCTLVIRFSDYSPLVIWQVGIFGFGNVYKKLCLIQRTRNNFTQQELKFTQQSPSVVFD